jgi:hypothetical protein
MTRHRYINLYVGIDEASSGRKGGEKHAPADEQRRVARLIERVLKEQERANNLPGYRVMEVTPLDEAPPDHQRA